jgi:hypothetical protein
MIARYACACVWCGVCYRCTCGGAASQTRAHPHLVLRIQVAGSTHASSLFAVQGYAVRAGELFIIFFYVHRACLEPGSVFFDSRDPITPPFPQRNPRRAILRIARCCANLRAAAKPLLLPASSDSSESIIRAAAAAAVADGSGAGSGTGDRAG